MSTTTLSTTTLSNVRIWDGQGMAAGNTLTFTGDVISAIGDRADLGAGGRVIDCAGATLMPGLIDAHVHLELNPDDRDPPQRTDPQVVSLMIERAAAMVAAGITTARDLGGGAWLELGLRDDIASGKYPGPRLLCSGQPITCPQGHCHFWGGEADSIAAALEVLERQREHGVDLIKVMATGGRITKGSDPLLPQFDLATLSAITARAAAHGLPVAAHCHGTAGIELAARAGVNTIEHCSWAGRDGWASDFQGDVASLILERGIWVSPTVNRGWQRMLDSKTGAVLQRVRSAYRSMLALGIPLVASTDAGIPGVYHHDLPHALVVFGRIAELDATQTLQTATSAAARALGIAHLTGRLAPGLAADMLLVDGDPLQDLTAITRPAGIWARGRTVLAP